MNLVQRQWGWYWSRLWFQRNIWCHAWVLSECTWPYFIAFLSHTCVACSRYVPLNYQKGECLKRKAERMEKAVHVSSPMNKEQRGFLLSIYLPLRWMRASIPPSITGLPVKACAPSITAFFFSLAPQYRPPCSSYLLFADSPFAHVFRADLLTIAHCLHMCMIC